MADLKLQSGAGGLPAAPNVLADADLFAVGQSGGGATTGVAYRDTLADLRNYIARRGKVAPLASSFTLTKDGATTASLADVTTSEASGYNGVLARVLTGSGDKNIAVERTTPGATWVMKARVKSHGAWGRFRTQGLHASDGTKFENFGFGPISANGAPASRHVKFTSITAFSAADDLNTNMDPFGAEYYKLELDATNLIFSLSWDGVTYFPYMTYAKGAFLGTITSAGIWVGVANTDALQAAHEQAVTISEFSLV